LGVCYKSDTCAKSGTAFGKSMSAKGKAEKHDEHMQFAATNNLVMTPQ